MQQVRFVFGGLLLMLVAGMAIVVLPDLLEAQKVRKAQMKSMMIDPAKGS